MALGILGTAAEHDTAAPSAGTALLDGPLVPSGIPTTVPPSLEDVQDTAGPYGFAYACKACDVYGYISPGEARRCWSCETGIGLEAR